MMYITYGNTKVSVNIALLKSRIKNVVIWVLKAMRTTVIISGIFLLLGTAGSSDLDLITFTEILYNLCVGICKGNYGITERMRNGMEFCRAPP